MAALGSAGRLVRKGAATFVAITRNVIGGGLQCATVESTRDTIRSVSAAVDQRLQMHSGNRAISLDAGFEFH